MSNSEVVMINYTHVQYMYYNFSSTGLQSQLILNTDTQTHRHTEIDTDPGTQTHRHRQTDRQTDRQTH